jgi:hypothetical protein
MIVQLLGLHLWVVRLIFYFAKGGKYFHSSLRGPGNAEAKFTPIAFGICRWDSGAKPFDGRRPGNCEALHVACSQGVRGVASTGASASWLNRK